MASRRRKYRQEAGKARTDGEKAALTSGKRPTPFNTNAMRKPTAPGPAEPQRERCGSDKRYTYGKMNLPFPLF